MKEKLKKVMVPVVGTAIMFGTTCFATGEGGTGVTTAIDTAVNSVKGDATTVIASAVGLGAIFWGAKVLWSKFKSMAK